MKQVTCNGLPFAIINGQRVWLTPPPPESLAEMTHDKQRAAVWPRLMESLK
jgi:hypothetical protein